MTEKEIYRLDEESVKDIVRWALTAQLPKKTHLGSEYIADVREYVKSTIRDINQEIKKRLLHTLPE